MNNSESVTFIIYKHTCTVTEKSYVGYSKLTIDKRWSGHCKDSHLGSNNVFHKAIRKYGVDAWKHEVLEDHIASEQEAGLREMHWIVLCESTVDKNGYNMTKGGLSRLTVWTPEMKEYHRKKTSEGTKRAFQDPVIKQRHKDATKIAANKPENRKRNSEAQIIAQNRPEVLEMSSITSKRTWNDPTSKLCARKKLTQQIDSVTGEVIKTFSSAHEAARTLGLSQGNISNCARRLIKSAYGFVWRYV